MRCSEHPAVRAAWRCEPCARLLCERCAVPVEAGRAVLPACPSCGGLAQPVLVSRSLVAPFDARAALRAALGVRALFASLVVAGASGFLLSLPFGWWLAGQLLLWGCALFCARRASLGLPAFSAPAYADLAAVCATLVPRFLRYAGLLALPAALVTWFGARAAPGVVALLLGGAAAWLVPLALVAALIDSPEPVRLFQLSLGADLRALRLFFLPAAISLAWSASLAPLDWLADTASLYAALRVALAWSLLATAVSAGALVHARAGELRHGDPLDDLVPLAPGAVPRGPPR